MRFSRLLKEAYIFFKLFQNWFTEPNVVKGTECRNAIKNGTASLEQQAVIKYLDLCRESTTGRDNYRRAFVAAQYNLTQEECQKYNYLLLQIHEGCIDNSFSEEAAVLIKVESISNPDYDIIELAIVINYCINNRDHYDISFDMIHNIRKDLEKLMKIKKSFF